MTNSFTKLFKIIDIGVLKKKFLTEVIECNAESDNFTFISKYCFECILITKIAFYVFHTPIL